MMEYVKLVSLFITALCIVLLFLNSNMLDEKFFEWRKERKRLKELDSIPHTDLIVHNARRRRK